VRERLKACDKLLQAVTVFLISVGNMAKSIDKARLRASVKEPDWSDIGYLAMDHQVHQASRLWMSQQSIFFLQNPLCIPR
jgi:hypothetical protein